MTEKQMRLRALRLSMREMDDLLLECLCNDIYQQEEEKAFQARLRLVENIHKEAGLLIQSLWKS